MAFKFTAGIPYIAELSDGNMRFFDGKTWLVSDNEGVSGVSTANPSVLTLDTPMPADWVTDSQVVYTAADYQSGEYAPALQGRVFRMVRVTDTTVTLKDDITGAAISGAAFAGTFVGATLAKIADISTPYTSGKWENCRKVQSSHLVDQGQDSRVTFLHPDFAPQSLSSTLPFGKGLIPELFTDGPYFDPPKEQVLLNPSGTNGTIILEGFAYIATAVYPLGAFVQVAGVFYQSLIDFNLGNTPSAGGPWVQQPVAWNSGQIYGEGSIVIYMTDVYYSLTDANTNNQPDTHPLDWSKNPPNWDVGVTYAMGTYVEQTGDSYVCIQIPNTGESPTGSTGFWAKHDYVTSPGYIPGLGGGSLNVGRLIRLQWGYTPWDPSGLSIYPAGANVNYLGNQYTSLIADNQGNEPDISPTQWQLLPSPTRWTWARIVSVNGFEMVVTIEGAGLPTADPIYTWRLGLYSDATGWPTCGTYHEGRLWFAGPVKNRFDASAVLDDNVFNFTPTDTDGTVSDANAISETLNSEEQYEIYWFASKTDGIIMGTLGGEWKISASNLDDPITPTSIQARQVSTFGCFNQESVRLPTAQAVIHALQRKVLEYKIFVDTSAYSTGYNAVNLLDCSKHLALGQVEEVTYQDERSPLIWARNGNGSLFAIAYKREPETKFAAPVSVVLAHGRAVESVAVSQGFDTVEENCWMITNDPATNIRQVEYVTDIFDEESIIQDSFFCDGGILPSGAVLADDNLSFKLFGLMAYAGLTKTIVVGGIDLGERTIAADGTLVIVFDDVLTLELVTSVVELNPGGLPFFIHNFDGPPDPDEYPFILRCCIGDPLVSEMQQLHPFQGTNNGPNFAKTNRSFKAGIKVFNTHEIEVGPNFTTMDQMDALAQQTDTDNVTPLGPADLTSGVFRQENPANYGYETKVAWRQTRPYPGTILAAGSFDHGEDL